MSGKEGGGFNFFFSLWRRCKGEIVQRVPDEYRACEFECRQLECAMGDWVKCEKRLRYKARSQSQS